MSGSMQSADRRIGMVIGDYTITKKLAEGGMGAVYLAENRPTGIKHIVKFMLAEFVANPALRERFEREIRAAVRLKGKTNIVEIYSCNERDGELYMTMEYLQGETLQDHLRRCGRISVHHAFRIACQTIAALHELHEAGIIHRDLKPQNIFVVPTDAEAYTVKLIDFGIIHDRHAVNAGAQKTQRGSLVGTPGYMALEQFGDAGTVTPAADVFALAVIIWEMFTGMLPWSAPNEFALYEKQKSEAPALPQGHHLPSGWEAIIRAALLPNPLDRPPLHALLYALAREVPAEAPIPNGFDMVVRYAPRVLRKTPVEVETVRASDAPHAAAAYWGIQRATVAPQATPASISDSIPISAPGFAPVSPSTPTLNARPVTTPSAPSAARQTTLSAAAGSSVVVAPGHDPTSEMRPRRLALVVASIGAAGSIVVGLALGLSARSTVTRKAPEPVEAVLPDQKPDGAPIEHVGIPADAPPTLPRATIVDAASAPIQSSPDAEPSDAAAPLKSWSASKKNLRTSPLAPPTKDPKKRTDKPRAEGSGHSFDPEDAAGE